jgi:catechol 2,3-dioxygenase
MAKTAGRPVKGRSRKKSLPKLTHLGINVIDLDKMLKFYTGLLGLKVSDKGYSPRLGYRIAFMTGSEKNHHQMILAECRPKTSSSTINQISFTWPSLDHIRALDRKLRKRGVKTTPIDHGNAWSIYFPDPEGNTIECYLDSPWQVAQPHGTPLDLSLSNAEIMARTKARIAGEKTFMPAKAWSKKMRARLAS